MEAGDLGVGEGLEETEDDRDRPHEPRRRADRRRDPAHRKENQGRDAGRNEDDVLPVDIPHHRRAFRGSDGH